MAKHKNVRKTMEKYRDLVSKLRNIARDKRLGLESVHTLINASNALEELQEQNINNNREIPKLRHKISQQIDRIRELEESKQICVDAKNVLSYLWQENSIVVSNLDYEWAAYFYNVMNNISEATDGENQRGGASSVRNK